MINLLPEEQENLQKWDRIKKLAIKLTTGVLIVYVLVASAIVGWAVFLGNKEGAVSDEVKSEEKKLVAMANVEALIRQLENRGNVVGSALSAEKVIGKLKLVSQPDVEIGSWAFTTDATQTLTVSGTGAKTLESYVDKLREKYPDLEIESIARQESGGWVMSLVLK